MDTNYSQAYNNNYIMDTRLNNDEFNGTRLSNNNDIKMISKELLNGLKSNNISLHDNDSLYDDTTNIKKKIKKNKKIINYDDDSRILTHFLYDKISFKELLLLFSLYFILSIATVKNFFGYYFTSLNGDENGNVLISGIITYGLILTVLFMIFKIFLI